MKLWLLKPIDGRSEWEPWYDKAFGFVVRAETENDARAIADKEGGDEAYQRGTRGTISEAHPWTDLAASTCVELVADGEPAMILRDFAAA